MAQFSTLYQQVQNRGFGPTMTTDCKYWVNQAYHFICNARRWSWLQQSVTFPTVASQPTYNLTGAAPILTDFAGLIDVVSPIGKLVNVNTQIYDLVVAAAPSITSNDAVLYNVRGGGTVAATPGTVISGNNIVLGLWPATTGVRVYTARYWRGTDSIEMVADSDVPIIPARHHWAIVALALQIGLAADDQLIQSNIFQGIGTQVIQQMLAMDSAMYSSDNEQLILQDTPDTQGKVNPAAVINPTVVPFPVVEVET
jgi:hypothetical protein